MESKVLSSEDKLKILTASEFFGELPLDILKELVDVISIHSYKTGEILFFQGVKADGFHVLYEGVVRVFRQSPEGKEQLLHLFSSGEPIGEVPVFQGKDYPATAEAVKSSRTIYLSRKEFIALGEKTPSLLFEMLALLSIRLRKFVHLIDSLSLKNVPARLANHLLGLYRESGESTSFYLESSKSIIAQKIGTVPETFSRSLARLQKLEIITVNGKKITIIEPEKLAQLAQGEKLTSD